MLKKFLMALGVLALLGIVGIVFIGNKIDSKLKEKEPEFRRYLTMTVEEQNAYVENNIQNFMQRVTQESDEKGRAVLDKIQNDPEVKAAAVNFGRSVVAGLIMASEPIVNDLTADVKAKLQAEVDETESRADKYQKLLEKYNLGDK